MNKYNKSFGNISRKRILTDNFEALKTIWSLGCDVSSYHLYGLLGKISIASVLTVYSGGEVSECGAELSSATQ